MLILSYLVCYLEIIAVWKNQIEIFDTFFVIWVESTAKVYGQPLGQQIFVYIWWTLRTQYRAMQSNQPCNCWQSVHVSVGKPLITMLRQKRGLQCVPKRFSIFIYRFEVVPVDWSHYRFCMIELTRDKFLTIWP